MYGNKSYNMWLVEVIFSIVNLLFASFSAMKKRTVTLFSLCKMRNASAAVGGVILISSCKWPIECKANLETRCGAPLGSQLDPHLI